MIKEAKILRCTHAGNSSSYARVNAAHTEKTAAIDKVIALMYYNIMISREGARYGGNKK